MAAAHGLSGRGFDYTPSQWECKRGDVHVSRETRTGPEPLAASQAGYGPDSTTTSTFVSATTGRPPAITVARTTAVARAPPFANRNVRTPSIWFAATVTSAALIPCT